MNGTATLEANGTAQPEMKPILGMNDVTELFGVTKTTIQNWMRDGLFPRGTTISARARYWRREVIIEWMERREREEAEAKGGLI